MTRMINNRIRGGKFRGYGWPATLNLLSPPIGKPVDSRRHFEMIICPACKGVHELGGICVSRHRHNPSPFNGYLDDLTVWNRTLSQGEIRAMNYLDRGLNGIVVPRGLFFQSQFFSNLNTTTFSYSSPVLGATAIGNDNPRELNSRTIQQLIAANLTLAQAWTWIDQLTRNESGNLTSFPLVVTSEIYTMGFDSMVLNVLPNVTVENSGNSSVPPPPIRQLSWWEAVWNSFTGLVSALWDAVVAVATFVANVALAVIKWCMDFAVAIANGEGLQFFYDTVVKPFVDAVMAFVRFVVDLIVAAAQIVFNAVVQPMLGLVRGWGLGILAEIRNAYERLANGQSTSDVGQRLGSAIVAAFTPLFVLGVLLAIVSWLLAPFMFVLGLVVAALSAVWMAAMLVSLSASPPQNPGYQSPLPPWDTEAIFAAALDFGGIDDDSADSTRSRSEGSRGTRGDSEAEDWQIAIFSLVFAGASLLFDIVAGFMIEPSVGAIVLGIGSFLIVLFTVGAIAGWYEDLANALLLLDLVLSLYGLVAGFLAAIRPGPAQGFGISGFIFSVVSFTVAYAGISR